MREGANNPNGNNMAGMGMGLSAGAAMGNLLNKSLEVVDSAKKQCPECGAQLKQSAKFCPECGYKFAAAKKHCVFCNAEINAKAKFCPECGKNQNTTRVCSKCNFENTGKGKFCANCGEKL
jgi:membrane protease subunit (stomatin/prohibitin family)